ncbi:MAG: class I SAM-dependent methyltransferase [Ignavibacteriae bacterium]|nr:class I SAM-dependent methyltransferase [Ignavibacteriota bacterium]
MSKHSVEDHFHFKVSEYDTLIRNFIPYYETVHAMIARWCAAVVPPKPRIIELGGGTGALTATIAEHFPDAEVELWDIDEKMLELARHRLARYGSRVKCIERSFYEPLPECDAVVACIALHHIKEVDQKTRLYTNVYRSLRSPGVLANGDSTMTPESRTQKAIYQQWLEFMGSKGIPEQEARQHFANWADEDKYFSLDEEFVMLKKAGFQHPECFWRYAPMTVYGGVK